MDLAWSVRLFGGLSARQTERDLRRFRTQKTAGVFAYLALHVGKPQPREVLFQLFWPDWDIAAARHNLSNALSSLRRQLEPPGFERGSVLVTDRQNVLLRAETVVTDVGVFEHHLRAARNTSGRETVRHLEAAAAQVQGPFLPGFYDDWVMAEQERLHRAYFQSICRLVELLRAGADYACAEEHCRRALSIEPLCEEVHRSLLQVLIDSDRPDAGLREYQGFRDRLEAETGLQPSAATVRLAKLAARQNAAQAGQALTYPSDPPKVPRGTHKAGPRQEIDEPARRDTLTLLMIAAGPDHGDEPLPQSGAGAMEAYAACLREGSAVRPPLTVPAGSDGMFAAFSSLNEAAEMARQLLRRQSEGSLPPARLALTVGDVEVTGEEFRGPAVRQVAELAAAAHPGQLLATEAAGALIRECEHSGLQVRDLGAYRFPGGIGSSRLFQVGSTEAPPPDFPPLRAALEPTARLPVPLTRFIGRQSELLRLEKLLTPRAKSRLVTLTGPGGTGKTRLAAETGRRLSGAYRGAIWFVRLSPVADPTLIGPAILHAMQLASSLRDPLEHAAEVLDSQPSLLILDNLEQLLGTVGEPRDLDEPRNDLPAAEALTDSREGRPPETAATVVLRLLEAAPSLTVLVTSRRLLNLPGERRFPVPPLPTPPASASPEALCRNESVRLFLDRAQSMKPDFQVTPRNAPAVAELCGRLEGIPLALELAASRALVVTPGQMLEQLSRRFEFLVNRSRQVETRHRTLRATIDWSYRLLDPALQQFFARLFVFRGGWTAEAAEQVCEEPRALDYLGHLQGCSLILSEALPGGMRFRMLETLREYAMEKMPPQESSWTRRQHAKYYLQLAETGSPGAAGEDQVDRLKLLDLEHDNFRTALDWALRIEPETALRMSSALARFWEVRGHFAEGWQRLREALERAEPSDCPVRAGALVGAAQLVWYLTHFGTACELLEQALEIQLALGDEAGAAASMNSLALMQMLLGRYEPARRYGESGLALLREARSPDTGLVIQALNTLGMTAMCLADYGVARDCCEEALQLARQVGDQRGAGAALQNLGLTLNFTGENEEARPLLQESLELMSDLGDVWGTARARYGLAHVTRELREFDVSARYYHEVLTAARDFRSDWAMLHILDHSAALASLKRQWLHAGKILSAVEANAALLDSPIPPAHLQVHLRSMAATREGLGEQQFQHVWREGQALSLPEAVAYVLTWLDEETLQPERG
jgi:predicted ATPase/DNA-binding SARP family transcriptional activator